MGAMHLDHLSYAAGPEGLAACVQRLGANLGAGFTDGGLHPSFGTRNFVLPLRGGCYLEVVEALEHPAVDRAPFGRAVRDRCASGGGWLGWVLAVDDIAPVEQRLGRPAVAGHRRRPDGFDLRWRQIGVKDAAEMPQLPFFVKWDSDPSQHPGAPGSALDLVSLHFAGDAGTVERHLGLSPQQLLDAVAIEWSLPGERGSGLVEATFETASGRVTID